MWCWQAACLDGDPGLELAPRHKTLLCKRYNTRPGEHGSSTQARQGIPPQGAPTAHIWCQLLHEGRLHLTSRQDHLPSTKGTSSGHTV